jgi:hypothetical protein
MLLELSASPPGLDATSSRRLTPRRQRFARLPGRRSAGSTPATGL